MRKSFSAFSGGDHSPLPLSSEHWEGHFVGKEFPPLKAEKDFRTPKALRTAPMFQYVLEGGFAPDEGEEVFEKFEGERLGWGDDSGVAERAEWEGRVTCL